MNQTIFIASLRNELNKIIAKKKFYVFLFLEIIICLLATAGQYIMSVASDGMLSIQATLGNMPFTSLSFFIQIYIPLLIFMVACDLFSGEFHDGTIRAFFMRPISRFKLYFSKILAILIMVSIYLGVLLVTTLAIKIIATQSMQGVGDAVIAYVLDILPLIGVILFAALINQFSSNPSFSIVISIIIYMGLYVLGIMVPHISGLLFTGYAQWHNLWLGIALPFHALLAKIGIIAGYGIIFGCVGYYLFERREV